MCLGAGTLRIWVCAKAGYGNSGRRGRVYVSSKEIRGESKGPCGVGVGVWMELQDTSISIPTSLQKEATVQMVHDFK